MPDISMCLGQGCILRARCYRYTAIPNPYRQAYIAPEKTGLSCDYYWCNGEDPIKLMRRVGTKRE